MKLHQQVKVWPTVTLNGNNNRAGLSEKSGDGLNTAARDWPTPRSSSSENRTTHHAPSHGKTHGRTLAGEAGEFSTQRSSQPEKVKVTCDCGRRTVLPVESYLTTPCPACGGFSGSVTFLTNGSASSSPLIAPATTQTGNSSPVPVAVEITANAPAPAPDPARMTSTNTASTGAPSTPVNWPTPASRDAKGANSELHCTETGTGRKHMDQSPNFVAFGMSPSFPTPRPDPATSMPGGACSPSTRRLNLRFVEWLMEIPTGWTDCDSAEMAWCPVLWPKPLSPSFTN